MRDCSVRTRALTAVIFASLSLSLATDAAADPAPPLEITTDTVWQGAVEVMREVRVFSGATLLVLPGTRVRFSADKNEVGEPKARLLVNGTLIAQGTTEDPIIFTSARETPQPGDWGGIMLDNSHVRMNRLRHARIEYATNGITGLRSALLAENATLRSNVTGVYALQELQGWLFQSVISGNGVGLRYYQNSQLQVENCEITGNSDGGIACILNSSPKVRQSLIADNGARGVVCIQGSSPLLEGNTIRGHQRGVFMELQARPAIVRNAILGNETGIWGEKLVFPKVIGNNITGNATGIYCNYSAYMQINGNNIQGNTKLGLVIGDNMSILMEKRIPFRHMGEFFFGKPPEDVILPEKNVKNQPFPAGDEGVVDARGNWWGQAATDEMERLGAAGNASFIEDFFDKPDTFYGEEVYPRDRVAYAPWEKEPLKDAGPPVEKYSGVSGKVVFGGKPVAGVRVHAYTDATTAFRGEGYAFSAPTDREGSYSLNLISGSYYLVAKSPLPPFPYLEPGPGAYFGYYGGNPVQVNSGTFGTSSIHVVQRKEIPVAGLEDSTKIRVEGVVLGPDGPVAGAAVHVYTDASRQFRGPDLFGPQGAVPGGTDEKGSFSIDLPAGAFFLVASKRKRGETLGPLQPGDLHGYYDGNPLAPAPGTKTTVAIQIVEKLRDNLTSIAPSGGRTGIRGKVLNPSGKVPVGVYAFATTDPSFMIGSMPPHRSRPVGEDGSFSIDLPDGGTYYISARSGYGGPPLPGEWHGFHGDKTPRPITVEKDHVAEGVDVVIRKME